MLSAACQRPNRTLRSSPRAHGVNSLPLTAA